MTQQITQTRAFTHQLVTIVANTCESGPVDVRAFQRAQLHIPGVWTASGLGIKVSPVDNTLYKPLYCQAVGAVRTTSAVVLVQVCSIAANNAYAFPCVAEATGYAKLWSQDGAGVNVDQTADRVIGISLKG